MRVSVQWQWFEAVSYLYFWSTLHPLLLRNGVCHDHRLKHRVIDARNGWSWEDSMGTDCINFGGSCLCQSRKECMYYQSVRYNLYYLLLHFRNRVCDWVFVQIMYNALYEHAMICENKFTRVVHVIVMIRKQIFQLNVKAIQLDELDQLDVQCHLQ